MEVVQIIKDCSLAISPFLAPAIVYLILRSFQKKDAESLQKFRSISDAQLKLFETLWTSLTQLEDSVTEL
ncbi:hypothetical protein BDW_06330 [Bdellovibrio bacteriovorus W]|nr:hypothetical protein BDW_06330 [Bdellovibrio bacteriovorus W]